MLESPFRHFTTDHISRWHDNAEFFPVCRVYQAHIPTYPSGHWLFGFASKKYDPVKDLDADKWNKLGLKTKYYNTDIHTGAFALPNYVIDLLKASHE